MSKPLSNSKRLNSKYQQFQGREIIVNFRNHLYYIPVYDGTTVMDVIKMIKIQASMSVKESQTDQLLNQYLALRKEADGVPVPNNIKVLDLIYDDEGYPFYNTKFKLEEAIGFTIYVPHSFKNKTGDIINDYSVKHVMTAFPFEKVDQIYAKMGELLPDSFDIYKENKIIDKVKTIQNALIMPQDTLRVKFRVNMSAVDFNQGLVISKATRDQSVISTTNREIPSNGIDELGNKTENNDNNEDQDDINDEKASDEYLEDLLARGNITSDNKPVGNTKKGNKKRRLSQVMCQRKEQIRMKRRRHSNA